MLKNKYEMKKMLYVLAGAMLAFGMLCGCASAPVQDVRQPYTVIQDSDPVPTSSGSNVIQESSAREESSKPAGTDSSVHGDPASITSVARIKDMLPLNINPDDCVVDVEDEHNPYDHVWDYGRKYDKYVQLVDDAGMWDVLFDADFYCDAYPMLAKLYHYDADLLLEHFQTVGVHEGRQASGAFNVAAYMDHCDSRVVKAFGENYVCYYFYWALNQDSQAGVDVSGDGYPLQLSVEMTVMQYSELKHVNEYRAEVGAEPVQFDPELAAFASYRAWVDFVGMSAGHDWIRENTDECDAFLDSVNGGTYAENKAEVFSKSGRVSTKPWYERFYGSPSHYKTMVSKTYGYFGCSNMYTGSWLAGDTAGIEYDIYTDTVDTPVH